MEKMTHDYIRQTIPEDISERGGALLRLVGGKTVPLETSIKEAKAAGYVLGNFASAKISATLKYVEPEPIAQTSDGAIKIISVKDGGQSESFTWGHEWAVRGSGFPVNLPPDDWSLQAVQVYLHGDETDRYDIDLNRMTEKSMTIRTAESDKPDPGAYPDAIIRFDFAKAGNFEHLRIPIKLVVD